MEMDSVIVENGKKVLTMAEYFAGGHLRFVNGEWRDDNGDAIDAVVVTRCKDCDAWKRNVGIVDSQNGHCFEHDIDTNGQDFCSYGERRKRR